MDHTCDIAISPSIAISGRPCNVSAKRNDSCPCGSLRKYKYCCQARPRRNPVAEQAYAERIGMVA